MRSIPPAPIYSGEDDERAPQVLNATVSGRDSSLLVGQDVHGQEDLLCHLAEHRCRLLSAKWVVDLPRVDDPHIDDDPWSLDWGKANKAHDNALAAIISSRSIGGTGLACRRVQPATRELTGSVGHDLRQHGFHALGGGRVSDAGCCAITSFVPFRSPPRTQAADEKERKRRHQSDQLAKAEQLSSALEAQVRALENILKESLGVSARVDLDAMRAKPDVPALNLGELVQPLSAPSWESYAPARPNSWFAWFPGIKSRYQVRLTDARLRFERDLASHRHAEAKRVNTIQRLQDEHATAIRSARAQADARNGEIDNWQAALRRNEKAAVAAICELVLERSIYPVPSHR